jgi:hypothetical protein
MTQNTRRRRVGALTVEGGNRWQWQLKDGEGDGGPVTSTNKLLEGGGWGTASMRSNLRGDGAEKDLPRGGRLSNGGSADGFLPKQGKREEKLGQGGGGGGWARHARVKEVGLGSVATVACGRRT